MENFGSKAVGFTLVPALTYGLAWMFVPQTAEARLTEESRKEKKLIVQRDTANLAAMMLGLASVGSFLVSRATSGRARSVSQGAALGSALAAGLVLLQSFKPAIMSQPCLGTWSNALPEIRPGQRFERDAPGAGDEPVYTTYVARTNPAPTEYGSLAVQAQNEATGEIDRITVVPSDAQRGSPFPTRLRLCSTP